MQDTGSIPVQGTKSPTCFEATKSAFSPQLEKPAHHTEDPAKPKEKQKTLFLSGSVDQEIRTFSQSQELPQWLSGKEFPYNAGDAGNAGSVPGLGRAPGGGHGNPPQYSCLKNLWTEEPEGLQSTGSQRVGHD